METPKEINAESKTSGRLNNLVAISVALLAAFMAVTKVKDDNIVQAMLQAKSDAIDTWGEYQAKRIKHHLVELSRDQTLALRAGAAAQSTTQLENQAQHYQTEIARYEEEEGALQKKARAFEAFQVLGNGFVAGELFTIIGGDSCSIVFRLTTSLSNLVSLTRAIAAPSAIATQFA